MDPKSKTVMQLVGVVIFMGGLAWASVPLYDLFCRVTGFGGTTAVAESGSDEVLDRVMKINFDASRERGMPWDFRAEEASMDVRIGETAMAWYVAHNPTDRPVAGTATFNVAPYAAGGYFTKIACFCFQEQVLQPGETMRMPVTFFVDPALVDDPEAAAIAHITLSYTFHEIDVPDNADQAALSAPSATDTN